MKRNILLLVFLSICTLVSSASEDKPRVLILPMEEKFESAQYRVVASTLYESVLLTLRLLGKQEILTISADDGTSLQSQEDFSSYASSNSIDNIVSGSVSVDEAGEFTFVLDLFESSSTSIVKHAESRASGVLEVFDASDELIRDLLSSFSEKHIGFGRLSFVNTGYPGDYEVYLGDVLLGENIESSERILSGTYDLSIRSWRMGTDLVLDKYSVTLADSETISIEFALPYLMPEEVSELERMSRAVAESMERKGAGSAGIPLEKAFAIIDPIRDMPGVEDWWLTFKEQEALWTLRQEWWDLEESLFFMFLGEKDTALQNAYRITALQEPWVTPAVKEQAALNARLYCHILSLKAAEMILEDDFLEGGMRLYEDILEIGKEFNSRIAFGFTGEYEQLSEIMNNSDEGQKWKRNRMQELMNRRAKLAEEIRESDSDSKVMVMVEPDELTGLINGKETEFPYFNDRYKKEEMTLTLQDSADQSSEDITIPFPGMQSFIFIPEDDPYYRKTLEPENIRDWQRFHFYLGGGYPLHISGHGQVRYWKGRLGNSLGMVTMEQTSELEEVESFSYAFLTMDFFLPSFGPSFENWLSIGMRAAEVHDQGGPYLSAGIAYKYKLIDFYALCNFIPDSDTIDGYLMPQVGIRF